LQEWRLSVISVTGLIKNYLNNMSIVVTGTPQQQAAYAQSICNLVPALCNNGTTTIPVRVNTNPDGTPILSAGGTTLDKLLAALTTNIAIIKGAGYIPTTQQPNSGMTAAQYQAILSQQALAQQQGGGLGANLGNDIQNFVQNNTGLLLIGVVALVLFKSGRK
jgi:hypothetical protein